MKYVSLLLILLLPMDMCAQSYSTRIGLHTGSSAVMGGSNTFFHFTENAVTGLSLSQRLGKSSYSLELYYDRWGFKPGSFTQDVDENGWEDENWNRYSRDVIIFRYFYHFLDLGLQKNYRPKRFSSLEFPVSAGLTISHGTTDILDSTFFYPGYFDGFLRTHLEHPTDLGGYISGGAQFYPCNGHLGAGLALRTRIMPSFGAPVLFYMSFQLSYRFGKGQPSKREARERKSE